MFHRINESMGLGMHPTILCPRRNRIAPTGDAQLNSGQFRVLADAHCTIMAKPLVRHDT